MTTPVVSEPFDAVFTPVEGSENLVMHPKFRNQSTSFPDMRLAIPPGVVKVMASWNYTGQNIRVMWALRTEEGGNFDEVWKSITIALVAGESEANRVITIPSNFGALLQVITSGVPTAELLAAKPTVGIQVIPSLSDMAGGM